MKTEAPADNGMDASAIDAAGKQSAYIEERRRYWDDYARAQRDGTDRGDSTGAGSRSFTAS